MLGTALLKRNSCHHCEVDFAASLAVVDGDSKVLSAGQADECATVFGQVARHADILKTATSQKILV